MRYGLIIPKIETREEGVEHVLGATGLPEPVINPSGDWVSFLPDKEPQSKTGIETRSCTIWGTENAKETQIFFKTGVRVNYSDRYPANIAKQKGILNPYSGADPHQIAEMFRNESGDVSEERAPWTADIKTVEQYFSLNTTPLIPEAIKWYGEWKLRHKWLWNGSVTPQEKRKRIQDALTKGTVCVSVSAWSQNGGLYYKPEGSIDNHWTMLAQAEGDKPYKVFDSYDTFVKDLDPFYDFEIAKVYFLTPVPHLFLKNLGFQMMNPEIPYLQKALISLGYSIPHAVTDVYGVETRAAVAKFQVDNGIVGNFGNNFGPKTRYAMNVALNPTQPFGGSFITFIGSLFSGV